jgi:hypothetical protein
MTSDVIVQLYWIPSGLTGRLVVLRRMTGPGTKEFWASDPVSELRVATIDPAAQPEGDWHRLLIGLLLPELTVVSAHGPIVLRAQTDGDLSATPHVQAPLLAGAALHFQQIGPAAQVGGARVVAPDGQLATLPFVQILRRALSYADMAPAPAPPVGERPATPALWQELHQAMVGLEDVRGAQIGDHNVQINRFVVRGPADPGDLGRLLRDPRVQDAQKAVLAAPAAPGPRAALVATLQNLAGGWNVTAAPLVLSAESQPPGLLERLLTFDVQGVQLGNGNTQHNSFQYYVTDVPAVDQLLSKNPALAKTLAAFLCPETGQVGNLDPFRSQLATSLQGLQVNLDGRLTSVELAAPEPGSELLVRGVDGLTVGTGNITKTQIQSVLDIRWPHRWWTTPCRVRRRHPNPARRRLPTCTGRPHRVGTGRQPRVSLSSRHGLACIARASMTGAISAAVVFGAVVLVSCHRGLPESVGLEPIPPSKGVSAPPGVQMSTQDAALDPPSMPIHVHPSPSDCASRHRVATVS